MIKIVGNEKRFEIIEENEDFIVVISFDEIEEARRFEDTAKEEEFFSKAKSIVTESSGNAASSLRLSAILILCLVLFI